MIFQLSDSQETTLKQVTVCCGYDFPARGLCHLEFGDGHGRPRHLHRTPKDHRDDVRTLRTCPSGRHQGYR
jgi:hypothetical protein